MRTFLAAFVLALFLAPVAFAGGGSYDDTPQQQMAPETKVIVVPPSGGNGNVIGLAIVAAIGAAGAVCAAYVSKRK